MKNILINLGYGIIGFIVSVFIINSSVIVYLFLNNTEKYSEATSTLLGSVATLTAGIFAFYGLQKQLNEQIRTKQKSDERKNLYAQKRYLENMKKDRFKTLQISNAIKADIEALTKRLEYIELNDFNSLKESLEFQKISFSQGKPINDLIIIEQNYFFIFESFASEIILLHGDVVKNIFYFYTWAKGYVETLKMANIRIKSGFFDPATEAKFIFEETTLILNYAKKLVVGLNRASEFTTKSISKIENDLDMLDLNSKPATTTRR